MALTERNIRNIFIYSVPKFISYSLNLITLPIFMRILTPADYGIITLALVFPAIAVSIFSLGLPSSVQRYYFEYRADKIKLDALIFSSQLYLYLSLIISSCAVFILKDFIAKLVMGSDRYGMAVFITYMAAYLGQMVNFYLILYQNMERATVFSVFTVTQTIISSVISLLLVWYFNMSYMGMVYGSLVGAFLVCTAISLHFNKNSNIIFSSRILIENIKYGLQLVPKSFTGLINRFFDKYMLNNILSLSAVGIYNIGQTVGNVLFMLMGTVWSSFQPVCYREVFDKGNEGSVSVGRIFTIFSYIALMPVLFLILFAKELIHVIAPASYYEAINIIIILSGGVATQVFGMFVSIQYAYSKKAYWIFPITVVGTLANIGANILLIPKLGMIGAGLSTVATLFIMNGLFIFIGQKFYEIRYEWGTISSLFAIIAGAMIAALYVRTIELNNYYIYLIKSSFIFLFVFIGIKSKLISRNSIAKILSSLFNLQKETIKAQK
jgi:O-antigen/teichoic acid export membrane protein